ncbi:cell death specification protein 2-like [Agrilus planipennis]|uniref:Cell death specification protein 2-like n=1 Tax=Agrilus planipennis TaxID=224129 RepID=A0A1W4X159_AGRPL|nr:cell death specification protein 2-like [Agrilus planipennis]
MDSPKSGAAITDLMVFRHGGMAEPLDCSTPALDLCVRRRRSPSPIPEGAVTVKTENHHYAEAPSSTVSYGSPNSRASSDVSDLSISSDPLRDLPHYPVMTHLPIISPLPSTPLNNSNGHSKPKITRPFKAYPKDPLTLAVGVATTETILGKDSAEAYAEFRQKMLAQVQATHNTTNKNMRRNSHSINIHNSDPTYLEKRKKNNEAAKRSRDARRAKEDEIAIRAAFLEQENIKLKYEVATLRSEMERLRSLVYN